MSLQDDGMLDAVNSYMILPEVKDPKYWWGGHIWNDNIKTNRFLYSFVANAGTEGLFYNAEIWRSRKNCALLTIFSIPNGRARSG